MKNLLFGKLGDIEIKNIYNETLIELSIRKRNSIKIATDILRQFNEQYEMYERIKNVKKIYG